MEITSIAFKNNEMIPPKYTCDGQDVNPPLTFSNIPEQTQSLALIVDDPDAPSGDWVHWLLWNIDPSCDTIIENYTNEEFEPETDNLMAIEGVTSAGMVGYHGPCPPLGIHHYQFKIYALDTILPLGPDSRKKDLESAMGGHIIDHATLVGLYERK